MEGPDGRVYNLLRLESGWSKSHPIANKAILLRVPDGAFAGEGTGDAPPLVFDSIVDMPGGQFPRSELSSALVLLSSVFVSVD